MWWHFLCSMLFMSYTFTRHVQSSLHSSTMQHPFNWIRISNFTHNRFMHLWWLLESNSRLFFHTSFIHRLLTLTLLQTHHLPYSQIPTTPPCIISSYHKSYIFFSSWYHSSSITQTQIYCPYLFLTITSQSPLLRRSQPTDHPPAPQPDPECW